ncbi:HIV Tat-specific factor 1 homolog [Anoplophora glabripennis]|uniref:HIV Tat-specific factor 1 homolog n=1 Tax=Anoplophora glabripennis TaxID=217634 RepID=UPI000874DC2B|nr:HIV Tat-specific factor 1 homolog [Anoplophora glabripennis]
MSIKMSENSEILCTDGASLVNVNERNNQKSVDEAIGESKQKDNLKNENGNECGKPSKVEDERSSNKQNETPTNDSNSYNPKDVHYEGDVAIYTEPGTNTQYQWDNERKEWTPRNNIVYGFEDDTHVYTDSDGMKYFWDKEKTAWFPKVDEDFMARYQMSYGFVDNTKIEVKKPPDDKVQPQDPKKVKGEKRKASEPTWFEIDENQNTNVYVSHLPIDIEEQEFVDLMQKCGLVMRDPQSGNFKVKLYKEPGTDIIKGDALCTYIKIESVDLALKLLDGYDYRGHKIKVEKAKFQLKGTYDPKLKPKMKKKKDKLKMKKAQEKLFDWRPEKKIGERAKHERVVIVKNLFDPSIFDTDVSLILEFQQDLREECSKLGEVRKVLLYDRHPEGIAQINMGCPEEADQVVELLNGRWFMKRQLSAEIWDGRTKYKVAETDSQITQRIDKWDKFLEGGEEQKNDKVIQNDDDEGSTLEANTRNGENVKEECL